MFFCALKRHLRDDPVLVPWEGLTTGQGFRTHFLFDEAGAKLIKDTGRLKYLGELTVYIEELVMDFDDCPEKATYAEGWLRHNEVAHAVYTSGNRSIHIHAYVGMQPVSPKKLSRFVDRTFPGADTSFYHAGGLIRLPGTWHEKKPGHSKHVLREFPGGPLELDFSGDTEPDVAPVYGGIPKTVAEQKLARQLTKVTEAGKGRRVTAWLIATRANDAGLTMDAAIELLETWNDRLKEPLKYEVLETKAKEAYAGRRGAYV